MLAAAPGAVVAQADGDRALVAGGAALLVADWSTTAWALRHGRQEANPLLGARPSRAALAAYNLAALGLYTLAETRLQPRVARLVALAVIGLESVAVTRNLAVGDSFAVP